MNHCRRLFRRSVVYILEANAHWWIFLEIWFTTLLALGTIIVDHLGYGFGFTSWTRVGGDIVPMHAESLCKVDNIRPTFIQLNHIFL